jgi:hypothetical protein
MSKARAPAKAADGGSAPRRVIDMMKEATGASDEDVCLMLQLCDGDPNKATEALLASGCASIDEPIAAAQVSR